jgi:acetylornithine deacetylase
MNCRYPGTGDKTVTFLGSHLDVVPANPETWTVDPFKLSRDGDSLYGRGTTDCLGHVALITDLFCSLAEAQPKLARTVIAVFIANEENGEIEGKQHYHNSFFLVAICVYQSYGVLK